jgi:excisionase family DNA binding protein
MRNSKSSPPQLQEQQAADTFGSIVPVAVSVEDAARIAGVGRTKIYEAIEKKELASLKAGRRRLIRVDAIHAWLRALEQQSAA